MKYFFEEIKDMFNDMPYLTSVLLGVILLIVFLIFDVVFNKNETISVSVIDKHYVAESSSVGSGYVTTLNGKSGFVTTYDYEPEKFLLIAKTESGEIITVECKSEIYYSKEIGSSIDCDLNKGLFTNYLWFISYKK